jgi:D-glycero-D-manno-heptose 1,7-bisphosphate phosphatase
LDRDGVVNRALVRDGLPFPPRSLDELSLEVDAKEALSLMDGRGFFLIVVSNQPDVGRGTMGRDVVDSINTALAKELPIGDFFICFHGGAENCDCRKPAPGLIFEAAKVHGLDLGRSYLVGDRWRDVGAGKSAGISTVFIDRGYVEKRPDPPADVTVSTTLQAAEWIVRDFDARTASATHDG